MSRQEIGKHLCKLTLKDLRKGYSKICETSIASKRKTQVDATNEDDESKPNFDKFSHDQIHVPCQVQSEVPLQRHFQG